MDAPTLADIKSWSKLDWEDLEYEDPQLQVLVDRAVSYVAAVTGIGWDIPPVAGVAVEVPLQDTAREAVQMRAEQLAFQGQEDYIDTGSDDQVSSFSAGPYSENRRDPVRLTRGGSEAGMLPVNPWNALNQRLWLLMTPDREDFWRERFGQMPPAFRTTEVDWSASDLYPPVVVPPFFNSM